MIEICSPKSFMSVLSTWTSAAVAGDAERPVSSLRHPLGRLLHSRLERRPIGKQALA